MISGFCHGVSEVFTFLECSAALFGSYRCFETGCWYQNVGNYQSTLCDIPRRVKTLLRVVTDFAVV